MSVLDFPASPTNGQYYNGFVWNAANETWDSAFAPRAATIPITSPNYIINGAFDINQRNFTSTTGQGYGFDRWSTFNAGGTSTYSSQAFTVGTLLGSEEPVNFARIATTGQSASGDYSQLFQAIEDVRRLAGHSVTISFWAKAASGTPKVAVEIQQNFGSGGSPSATVNTYAGQVTLSTTWTRYSLTVAVPSTSGRTIGTTANTSWTGLALWVSAGSSFNARTGSLGAQNNTFDFWGFQVEDGIAPTEFRRNAPSLQGELAACQRYYQRINQTEYESPFGFGIQTSSTSSSLIVHLPTALRVKPLSVTFSEVQVGDKSTVSLGGTIVSSNVSTTVALSLLVSHASFGAQFRPAYLQGKGTAPFNSFIEVNAEL